MATARSIRATVSAGLSVCFDTQDNGSGDVVGISVRLDNVILTNVAFPVLNGICGDTASLQTGPYDAANPGSPDSLCWARLVIRLETNQNLTITYKSAVVISNLPTAFSPSPLRLVLAAHTGTATECHHVDNISLMTIPIDFIPPAITTVFLENGDVVIRWTGGGTLFAFDNVAFRSFRPVSGSGEYREPKTGKTRFYVVQKNP